VKDCGDAETSGSLNADSKTIPGEPEWSGSPWPLAEESATRDLGSELARRLSRDGGHTLLLSGELGMGKTCLVQGLARGLGIDEPVTSPTFALSQHYEGRSGSLVHLDLYRLEQPEAADELLAQEQEIARGSNAVLAVEWPERLSCPPPQSWCVELRLLDPGDPDRGRLALIRPPAAFPG
jgi:tRNA threonylcarbamoyladenosine biosynthesis protein TsaE